MYKVLWFYENIKHENAFFSKSFSGDLRRFHLRRLYSLLSMWKVSGWGNTSSHPRDKSDACQIQFSNATGKFNNINHCTHFKDVTTTDILADDVGRGQSCQPFAKYLSLKYIIIIKRIVWYILTIIRYTKRFSICFFISSVATLQYLL